MISCVTILHCVRVDLWVCVQFDLCYIAWEMNAVRHQSPVLISVNEIVHPKMKILSLFAHLHVVLNPLDFICSVEHKIRCLEKC